MAIAFSITLLDDESEDRDVTKRKGLKIDKLGKMFKVALFINSKTYPIVPLFGDIAISLSTILAKAPAVKNNKWDLEIKDIDAVADTYMLLSYISMSRSEFREVIASLNNIRPQVRFL